MVISYVFKFSDLVICLYICFEVIHIIHIQTLTQYLLSTLLNSSYFISSHFSASAYQNTTVSQSFSFLYSVKWLRKTFFETNWLKSINFYYLGRFLGQFTRNGFLFLNRTPTHSVSGGF